MYSSLKREKVYQLGINLAGEKKKYHGAAISSFPSF